MNTQMRRCMVVCDNGQRISQKDKSVMDCNKQKKNKPDLNIKKHIENIINNLKSRKNDVVSKYQVLKAESPENIKKIRNTAVAAVCMGIAVCVASVFLTAGYDVYINGKHIGIVAEKEEFETVLDEVNSAISEVSHSTYGSLFYKPSYVMKIYPRKNKTTVDNLRKNVAESSDVLRYGATIIADGKAILTTDDESMAKKTVAAVVNSYNGENAKLLTNIEYVNEYIAKDKIVSADNAYLQLRDVIKVETVKNVTYNEDVPFGTTNVENDSLYIGETEIATAGITGKQRVVADVTYINGVEASRNIISTEEISPASVQTVYVGTKKRPSNLGTGVMMLPFSGKVSSRFGEREGRRTSHKGVDLAGAAGSAVIAADNGTVIQAQYRYDYGNIIVIDHNNGLTTYYAHLNKMNVSVGDVVEKGQTIGLVGSTGISTGPHLHFEVRRDGTPINPYSYMK